MLQLMGTPQDIEHVIKHVQMNDTPDKIFAVGDEFLVWKVPLFDIDPLKNTLIFSKMYLVKRKNWSKQNNSVL